MLKALSSFEKKQKVAQQIAHSWGRGTLGNQERTSTSWTIGANRAPTRVWGQSRHLYNECVRDAQHSSISSDSNGRRSFFKNIRRE